MSEKIKNYITDNQLFSPELCNKKLTQMIANFNMPKWILDNNTRKCCECNKLLQEISVREVGLCLNAQNIGDIQVEILCQDCHAGYYLYFRKASKSFVEFSKILISKNIENNTPVQHTKLTTLDNNLTEAICNDQIKHIG